MILVESGTNEELIWLLTDAAIPKVSLDRAVKDLATIAQPEYEMRAWTGG